jgi:hypothetical protein
LKIKQKKEFIDKIFIDGHSYSQSEFNHHLDEYVYDLFSKGQSIIDQLIKKHADEKVNLYIIYLEVYKKIFFIILKTSASIDFEFRKSQIESNFRAERNELLLAHEVALNKQLDFVKQNQSQSDVCLFN